VATGTITIQRDRTETIRVELPTGTGAGYASDTFTSQIRAKADPSSALIATMTVDTTNLSASDYIELSVDNAVTAAITADAGWLDVIRTAAGEPLRVFDTPVRVSFIDMPTATA